MAILVHENPIHNIFPTYSVVIKPTELPQSSQAPDTDLTSKLNSPHLSLCPQPGGHTAWLHVGWLFRSSPLVPFLDFLILRLPIVAFSVVAFSDFSDVPLYLSFTLHCVKLLDQVLRLCTQLTSIRKNQNTAMHVHGPLLKAVACGIIP